MCGLRSYIIRKGSDFFYGLAVYLGCGLTVLGCIFMLYAIHDANAWADTIHGLFWSGFASIVLAGLGAILCFYCVIVCKQDEDRKRLRKLAAEFQTKMNIRRDILNIVREGLK
ncbi:MAG: hypothetical protein Q7S15_02030 [bacterium]|nr:hypothetical protein [bacterium]